MLDKDKIIIIMYVNVDYIDVCDIPTYTQEISDHIRFDESVIRLIVPVRDMETRIECINPISISEEEYTKVIEVVRKAQEALDEFLNSNKDGRK